MSEAVVEPVEPVEPAQPGAGLTCAAAFLATAAFGWVAGSVFTGLLARGLGLLAALVGVSVVLASTRFRRPALVQYAGAGVAVLLGALVVLPFTGQGTGLPTLVLEALRGGGLGQPPVAFDPGWRFLLVVAVALLGEASAGLAVAYGRPRLATALVVPLVVGAALLQPPGRELTGTLVGLLLLLASLIVSLGADQAETAGTSGSFELRRLGRGLLALVVLGAVLAGASRIGFLFPAATAQEVVPSMRPPTPPPAVDRVLFTVQSDQPLTWRLGTLDVYRSPAWLTPPFDSSTLLPVDGDLPTSPADTRGPLLAANPTRVRITLQDYSGKALPGLANPLAVRGKAIAYDPRTQQLRTSGTRPAAGTSYEVTAAAAPTGLALTQAGPPPAALRQFLDAPPPPQAVVALLARAPQNPFARLQYLRRAYFAKVVAAGSGNPVDVSAARVGELLQGKDASPYEITAGEALLARWAGVPARIGYGWFGGQPTKQARTLEIRPKNGATWLEAYFTGSGWVPIVGVPPRAKSSLADGARNTDPSVRPSDELALVVYAPVRLTSLRLPYVLVRYYALLILPVLLGGAVLLLMYPALWKAVRRGLRRRAARRLGPRAEIAAAYGELRDLATDLNIGHSALTPLEFVDQVAVDGEHLELAWLVTRALWGDLTRDLRSADLVAAQQMSTSVARRLRSAQPAFARLAALSSRSSLRDPWTRELPTLWRSDGRAGRRFALAASLVVLLSVVALSTGQAVPLRLASALSEPTVPASLGTVRLVREPPAEAAYRAGQSGSLAVQGRVYSLREAGVVQGSLQLAVLAADVDTRSPRVRDEVVSGFAGGRFRPARIGEEHVYRLALAEQTLLLAFDPDGHRYALLAVRSSYAGADQLFAALLAFGRGDLEGETVPDVPIPDPRRGSSQ